MRSIYFDVSIPKILATKLLSPVFPWVYNSPLSPVRFGMLPDPPYDSLPVVEDSSLADL